MHALSKKAQHVENSCISAVAATIHTGVNRESAKLNHWTNRIVHRSANIVCTLVGTTHKQTNTDRVG